MIQKWKVMLATFPYGGVQRDEITPWCMSAALWAHDRADIDGELLYWSVNDTPVTMSRNRAIVTAVNSGADILVLVDSDMVPDIDRKHPFLPNAFEFIKSRWHSAPTIISAPYCTAGPDYLPVMGTWRTHRGGFEIKSELYTREEAESFHGIRPCSLQGTGLMALDMRIFTGFEIGGEIVKLEPPWFRYEFTDATNALKATTEDMYFTRQVTLLFAQHGLEIGYVDWDAWAYHVKPQFVGKPQGVMLRAIAEMQRE